MVAAKQHMTIAEFAEIDEPGHFDLVDGEVWSMPPTSMWHGRIVTTIARLVDETASAHEHGNVVSGDVGFRLEPSTVLCPNVAFVSKNRSTGKELAFFDGPPDLAVEIISPSERASRVQAKISRYLEAGTQLVWCVYPTKRQVVIYSADGEVQIANAHDTLTAEPLIPGLAIDLASVFDAYA